jgi:hypothetical protein
MFLLSLKHLYLVPETVCSRQPKLTAASLFGEHMVVENWGTKDVVGWKMPIKERVVGGWRDSSTS